MNDDHLPWWIVVYGLTEHVRGTLTWNLMVEQVTSPFGSRISWASPISAAGRVMFHSWLSYHECSEGVSYLHLRFLCPGAALWCLKVPGPPEIEQKIHHPNRWTYISLAAGRIMSWPGFNYASVMFLACWRFPEMGVPLVIIHFHRIFPINNPFWGSPPKNVKDWLSEVF